MLYQHRKYGMVTPTVTLLRQGSIDLDAVKSLMQFLKKSGAKGAFIAGSTGNAPMLSLNEHKEVIKQYIKYAKEEHLATFVGIGRDSIDETVAMGEYSIELGADKLVAVTPYYMKEDQKQMHAYYSELLSKLDSEVLIYNIPSLTGNNIEAETVAKLAEENSNLIGIKSTNADFDQFQKLIYYTDNDFLVFQGYDHLLLPSLELGASGGVCGTTNLTDIAEKLYESYNRKEPAKSIKLHKQLSSIYHMLEPYEFPAVYNAMFYKTIMGTEIAKEPELFGNLSKKEASLLSKKLSGLL
ncbi:4-hydroxy-tetrahydrodipicolinate synthase [Candidatus Mancarchaeum acidiphilum]|uniref:4-hydroxy-tetrahydrodipicolinate synthase n=1 Tax=Candidatus Mancarchaeum acidiphilum TaxID=1920749 RepID=A0A218NMD2_9ARCH|nr:dihydrodipicolinate synthase family protein [Candidatus Mancarchaeum acidiphilum]ASI13629.1 4-hydroxy-tetrahydrodipicolinate synthase [Candidatus Mancarchaeum acidiphilum]